MNVYFKFLFLFLCILPIGYSFDVCNVDISSPWFLVNDSITNKEILIVDSQGDIYFEGRDHVLNNNGTEKSFQVGNAFFNHVTSKFNSFLQDQASVPIVNSFVIQNRSGINVTSFSNTGNIYTLGKGVYNGSQAGCDVDGNYCSGNIVETRDYYCNLTGSKSGSCNYNILGLDNCSLKLSEDSDGGINFYVFGSVKDYNGCSGSSCSFTTYSDSCSSNILTEYYNSSSTYSSTTKNCLSDNILYCSGTNVMTTNHGCSGGACNILPDSLVQSCVATATSYGSWSCFNSSTKVRSVTTYSPTCNLGACGSSIANPSTDDYLNCMEGEVCSGGSCVVPIDCVGFWSDTTTCSVTCGGGTLSQVYTITTPAQNGGASCPYANGATQWGSTSCNTNVCYPDYISGYGCASCPLGVVYHSGGVYGNQFDGCITWDPKFPFTFDDAHKIYVGQYFYTRWWYESWYTWSPWSQGPACYSPYIGPISWKMRRVG